jgi:hypothetical protein
MGQNGEIMAVFLVLLIPLLLMVFALLMERLEHRLRTSTMSDHDVEEFLEKAKPDEVTTFIREGWTGALTSFRRRRAPHGRRRPAIPAQTARAGGDRTGAARAEVQLAADAARQTAPHGGSAPTA